MKPSQMFAQWEQVREELLATIDKFQEIELTFTPFEGSWSAGQVMLHIADCEDNWLYGVVQHQIDPWINYALDDFPTHAEVKAILERAHKRTVTLLESLSEDDLCRQFHVEGETFSLRWIIWHVLEHEIHHRGELSLMLGMLGRAGLDV